MLAPALLLKTSFAPLARFVLLSSDNIIFVTDLKSLACRGGVVRAMPGRGMSKIRKQIFKPPTTGIGLGWIGYVLL